MGDLETEHTGLGKNIGTEKKKHRQNHLVINKTIS